MGNFICNATQKQLYNYEPDDGAKMVPDLAEGDPQVSEDGKTVTVKIKTGRQVLAAVQQGSRPRPTSSTRSSAASSPRWPAASSPSYFSDLVGAKVGVKAGTEIEGLTTPDPQTLVLKFDRAVGGVMASGALALRRAPLPVPKEYAAKFDKETPSTYGENQLSTGPYMISNDA